MIQANPKQFFIIDFDSTFVTVETLEVLAEITLRTSKNKNKILEEIQKITDLGMEGKISFNESLKRRLLLFQTNKADIKKLITTISKKITPSVINNKDFFRQYAQSIYIISGGFKEFIDPIAAKYGLNKNHVLANTFNFVQNGTVTGFDEKNPLSQDGGKVKAIQELGLKGKIYIIGDGFTDYQIRKNGHAEKFFAFTENIKRESVIEKADYVSASFDEILYRLKLPRSQSFPKTMIKALLIGDTNSHTKEFLQKEGYSVMKLSGFAAFDQYSSLINNTQILILDQDLRLPRRIFKLMPKLLAVGINENKLTELQIKKAAQNGIAIFAYNKFLAVQQAKYINLCKKIIKFINSGDTRLCFSLPEVSLPKQFNAHRIIHIHENKPGVLAKLNAIFAENNINIVGQYLKTNRYIGYAITDVNKDYGSIILENLKNMPETKKVRILY